MLCRRLEEAPDFRVGAAATPPEAPEAAPIPTAFPSPPPAIGKVSTFFTAGTLMGVLVTVMATPTSFFFRAAVGGDGVSEPPTLLTAFRDSVSTES